MNSGDETPKPLSQATPGTLLILAAILLFLGGVFLYITGPVTSLRCDPVSGGVTTCTRSATFLNILKVGEPVTFALKKAAVAETCTNRCNYRVELSTASGETIAFPDAYTSDLSASQRTAGSINAYLDGQSGPGLALKTGGGWIVIFPIAILLASVAVFALAISRLAAGR